MDRERVDEVAGLVMDYTNINIRKSWMACCCDVALFRRNNQENLQDVHLGKNNHASNAMNHATA